MADRITIAALKTAIETEHLPDNNAFEIDEADFREAHNDVIDTLVNLINTSSVSFTGTSGDATISLVRTVIGSSVNITGTIVNNDVNNSNIRIDLNNVITQNFKGFNWFRLTEVITVLNQTSTAGGHNGFIELDEMSSYNAGSDEFDKTKLHIPGTAKGTTRIYNIAISLPLIADRTEDTETDGYSTYSPLHISTKGLNISYVNVLQSNTEENITNSQTPSKGMDVSFSIKGELL